MLEIKNLHVSIDNKKILKGINLTIISGELHAIMGRNGSGKSTLSHVIVGKEGYEIEGEILFNGESLLGKSPEERALAGIFMSFQYPVVIPGVNNTYFLKAALIDEKMPVVCEDILNTSDHIRKVAEETVDADNYLYLGRGANFPVALEGALKLKEISYIHAEGYPAAEMKHGPIALIDEKMPVVFLAPHDQTFKKVLSNIQEVKARKGKIITVTDQVTSDLKALSDHVIEVSVSHPRTFPILATIPLQLLAYHLAVLRGCDVDMPRNLAKSVTVE